MDANQLYDVWWKDTIKGEQPMEDTHKRHWQKIIDMIIEKDLKGCSVLDFGCNQGGFLRFLYRQRPFKEGIGIDLALKSIEVANKRKGNLPLCYEATSEPEKFNRRFDLAVSSSVIYLISDLKEHALKIKQALKPGGIYYATYTDYAGNPSLPSMQEKIDANAALPMRNHSLDDIAKAFFQVGFRVGVRRMLPTEFIDLMEEDPWFQKISDRMQYEYEQAYIFRFVSPDE